MTITATADPLYTPPRVEIELELDPGAVMQSVTVYRVAGASRTPIREQPSAGFDSRTVYDYEAPYETSLGYEWETTYIDPLSVTELWAETWASMAAWTVTDGLGVWSVSGGELLFTGPADPNAQLTRSLLPGQYQFEFASVPGVAVVDFGGFSLDMLNSKIVAAGAAVSFVAGTVGMLVSMNDTGVSVTTSAGTFSVAAPGVEATEVTLSGPQPKMTYFSQWGQLGNGNTDFSQPIDIAIGPDDYVYVADKVNNRIKKFTSAGVYVTSWGSSAISPGFGDGGFSALNALTIDVANNIYVSDAARIQKFVPGATANDPHVFSLKWTVQSDSLVVVGPGGYVYVGERAVDYIRIKKFTDSGVYVTEFSSYGLGNGEFYSLVDMAVDSAGNLYALGSGWSTRLIQKFVPGATANDPHVFSLKWGAQLSDLNRLAVDNVGRVWVTGTGTGPIRAYVDGVEVVSARFAISIGTGDGQFSDSVKPIVVADSGDIYVADIGSIFDTTLGNRVQRFKQNLPPIGQITTSTYGGLADLTESSDPVTLSPADAWIVHPGRPGVSFPIGKDNPESLAGFSTIGAVENPSNSTLHDVLGSDLPVVTTSGPRYSDRLPVSITTPTRETELALFETLKDQTPLLFRVPPSWGIDFTDGFYSVGDVQRERFAQMPLTLRSFTLPLVAVDSPDVSVQNAGWSWAALAAEFATWSDVAGAFATWADVATNTRQL